MAPERGVPPRAPTDLGRGEDFLPLDVRRRLPARDPDALAQLFDAAFERVHAYVRGMVRHEQLAEDLTQDIFLLLYRGLPSYDPERELRPWVFTVAVNRVRDHWRSRRHRADGEETTIDVEGGTLDLDAGDAGPDAPLIALEDRAAVRAAVDALPPGMRETVLLRAFEELPFETIGELLGRNEVAIRKRYSRALELLRRALGTATGGGRE